MHYWYYDYCPRYDGFNHWWPNYDDNYEDIIQPNNVDMHGVSDSSFITLTTVSKSSKSKSINIGLKIVKEKVRKNSEISVSYFDLPDWVNKLDYIDCICLGDLESSIWRFVPRKMKPLYVVAINTKGFRFGLAVDRAFFSVLGGISRRNWVKYQNWTSNVGCDKNLTNSVWAVIHSCLRALIISMFTRNWFRSATAVFLPIVEHWPVDWTKCAFIIYRYWDVICANGGRRFVFGLHRFYSKLWDTDGPYKRLNSEAYH